MADKWNDISAPSLSQIARIAGSGLFHFPISFDPILRGDVASFETTGRFNPALF